MPAARAAGAQRKAAGAQRKKVPVMTDVACFCGCCFSFDAGAAACPRCGEVATVTAGTRLEDAGRSQPKIPVPVVNGTGQNGQTPQACPERAEPAPCPPAQRALFMTAVSSRAAARPFPELTREHSDMHKAMTATAQPSATDVYALGRDPGETARLQRQSEELGPDSAALLDRAGLRPGQDAIDLGCGPRGILDLLAERVKDSARARRRAGRGPGPRRHGQEVHRATRTRQRADRDG